MSKIGYFGKILTLVDKPYDFHAAANFPIALHPMG